MFVSRVFLLGFTFVSAALAANTNDQAKDAVDNLSMDAHAIIPVVGAWQVRNFGKSKHCLQHAWLLTKRCPPTI